MKPGILLTLSLLLMPALHAAQSQTIGPADRTATIKLPRGYNPQKSYPLILSLHGLSNSKELTATYLGLNTSQDRLGYILLLPEGTRRPSDQKTFWNAIPACCDNNETGVDDAGYLRGLVEEALNTYSVDRSKVYIFGHSNGGFMAHRLACDNDGLFTGMVSVAGSTDIDHAKCTTTKAISVLQVHGDEDNVVYFDTTARNVRYTGAYATVDFWASKNECKNLEEKTASKNLVYLKPEISQRADGSFGIKVDSPADYFRIDLKKETDVYTYSACRANTRVALWRVNGAEHAPVFVFGSFVSKALDFLEGR